MKRLITAGVDEVGRGCLAGPVVSAAVVLKKSINLKLLKDSKKITFNKREKISKHIKENSYFAIGIASVEEILKLNILQASLLSMKRALNQLTIKPDITLIDGNFAPEGIKKYITKARQMRSGSNVPVDQETTDNIAKIAGKEYEDKINQKYGGRRARRRQSTFTPPAFATRTGESGGPLPVSMRNKRVPKTSSIVPVDTSAIVPTKQTTIPKQEEKPEVKPDEKKVKPQEVDAGSGGIRPPRNIKKRFGPTPPKGPSEFSKSLTKVKDFANKNPVAALATYDLGKGVLGKILKTRQLAPGVVGGTVGRRSARGGGGL